MIDNFATVGMSYLSVYGYGPVNSEVNLKGFAVSEKTVSDETGLFRFNSVYSFTYIYPELCIQAVDNENRVTQPTCIPALPNNSIIPLEVGPILLSPTLSLSNNKVVANSESYLRGKTTPNTQVNIHIAKSYFLPVLGITSDAEGEFDINMPTSDSATYKVFASTKFGGNLSAKSNTLQFVVVSSFKSFFQRLLDFLLQNKMMIFIVAEVLTLIILFYLALKQSTKRNKRLRYAKMILDL